MNSAYHRDRPGDQGRGNASYSSIDRSQEHTRSGFGGLHNNFQFRSPADIHGDALKKKLDQTPLPEKSPFLISSVHGLPFPRPSAGGRFPAALSSSEHAQIPIHGGNPRSPTKTTETPIHSALSPRSTSFCHADRSPKSSTDIDLLHRTRIEGGSCDDAFQARSSYDFTGAEGMGVQDGQSLKRLHTDDTYASGGQKRRATSPNDDIATANSFGRRSPAGPSPGGISPTSCNSPYTAPVSLDPNPQTSISGGKSIHPETTPDVSTVKIIEIQMPNATEVQGFFMCECCKKPKRAHEDEKPNKCSICTNRFKNKNEAVRHEKSLHVRSHWWSCSALSGYDNAFHDSTTKPGEADICGYCGDDFLRSGRGPGPGALSSGNPPRHATDQDWDERTRHLEKVHKFRECDSSKKFFRADHFRQHVKHSHAGTLGQWTNMLENACMLEEDKETK
ncbi:zinc finger protein [Fusarium globosum]|uniref:Zinc finger protein n=1 Tax=Fusarium globosum TaxID=78864 RepID=A0A8H5Y4X5_9HYPO|nr:zinc finger protein [Fusarium globosum]